MPPPISICARPLQRQVQRGPVSPAARVPDRLAALAAHAAKAPRRQGAWISPCSPATSCSAMARARARAIADRCAGFHMALHWRCTGAAPALPDYDDPGNVRELETMVGRAVSLAPEGGIVEAFPLFVDAPGQRRAATSINDFGVLTPACVAPSPVPFPSEALAGDPEGRANLRARLRPWQHTGRFRGLGLSPSHCSSQRQPGGGSAVHRLDAGTVGVPLEIAR